MTLLSTSLNAVSSSQDGSILVFDKPRLVTMQVNIGTVVGNVSGSSVALEGSLDGTNFVNMGSVSFSSGNISFLISPSNSGLYVLYARASANIVNTATVTALISASD